MQIDAIYGPIQKDLLKVDEGLKALGRADLPWMAGLLDHILEEGGKRIRPALTLLAGKPYRYQLKLLLPMATAVELFWSWSSFFVESGWVRFDPSR